MGKTYLIDTNLVSKSFTGEISVQGQLFLSRIPLSDIHISFINRIELLSWKPADISTIDDVFTFLSRVKEWTISEEIIHKTVEIRQTYRIKIPDAIIAATAIVHDLILLSDNDRDFGKIPRLRYINPQKLAEPTA